MTWFAFWIGVAVGIMLLAIVLALLGLNFVGNNSEEANNESNFNRPNSRNR